MVNSAQNRTPRGDYGARRRPASPAPSRRQTSRTHNVRQPRSSRQYSTNRRNQRSNLVAFLPIIGVIAAAIILIVLVINLLRSCSAKPQATNTPAISNLSQTLFEKSGTSFSDANTSTRVGSFRTRAEALVNHDTLIAKIAAEHTAINKREGLNDHDALTGLLLTSRNSQAASYVYGLNKNNAQAVSYNGSTNGSVPKLYQWDERWGYVEYCGMPLGFSGCGVTCMAMARMGLTGKTDMTPADMAQLAVDEGEASAGTLSSFFISSSTEEATGIHGERLESTDASLLTQYASKTSYVLVNVRANTLAGGGHYILVVGVNADGTLEIRDPNSPDHTAQSWSAEEIAGYATAYTVLSAA